MAACNKVVYIYIEGPDLIGSIPAQQKKHEDKGRTFTIVKYTQKGMFEPPLPVIDAETKVIIDGHCAPGEDRLWQRQDGGVSLTYQAIADGLAKKMHAGETRIRVALRGCETGVGDNRASPANSLAGKLFRSLIKKGLKPTVAANLSDIRNDITGKLDRAIVLKKQPALIKAYNKCAEKVYQDNFIVLSDFRKFKEIQENRERITDSHAQGSKVVLAYKQSNYSFTSSSPNVEPEIKYPYGHPNDKFSASKLNSDKPGYFSGKVALARSLGIESIFAQKFKGNMDEAREELKNIFNDFEQGHPKVRKNKQYLQLKNFLLTADYYIDANVINAFILEQSALTEEDRESLIAKINENTILNDFRFAISDLHEISQYEAQSDSQFDFSLGYLQLGLDIIQAKIANYPCPIVPEMFALLDESTQRHLAIELGKQMVGDEFDAIFIEQCIVQLRREMR